MFRSLALCFTMAYVAFGCTCRPYNPKIRYCHAEVVGLFTVEQQVNSSPVEYFYRAHPTQIFKSKENSPALDETLFISTMMHSAACGLSEITPGENRLLSGYYDSENNIFSVSSCSQISAINWDKVPDDVKTALQNGGYDCTTTTTPKH
ncbi:hypothetical protein L596_028542 [Steinernema carpocapsae]|uniref:NTR domain-containing protein n=1 Tax=Steinernema carpocapsae TaxID=34508 RepID=A0A4U5LYR6_STECR|nr:hypothetical protein L596_028542 [Steinernema carpocapsae]